MSEPTHPNEATRRGFFQQACAWLLGGLALLAPVGAGLRVFLDPVLRRHKRGGELFRVGTLDTLPEDGTPRRFPIRAARQDAWTRWPVAQVGAVYLRRTGPKQIQALSVICPHAGCHVHFDTAKQQFICPCHASAFDLSGKRLDPARSPSPRALDELEVELRESGEIWVRFVKYRLGVAERIPEA